MQTQRTKEIVLRDRVRKLPEAHVTGAIEEAKSGKTGKTSFGISIKRVKDILILL